MKDIVSLLNFEPNLAGFEVEAYNALGTGLVSKLTVLNKDLIIAKLKESLMKDLVGPGRNCEHCQASTSSALEFVTILPREALVKLVIQTLV